MLSQQWTRIVDMSVEKAKEAAKISGDTGKELGGLSADLQDYLGSFETQALNFKGLHTPYVDKNGKDDTFDTEELVRFEEWAQKLRELNPVELIDALNQNEIYTNTLLVLQGRDGGERSEDFQYLDFRNPENVEHFMEFILGNDKADGKNRKSRFRTQTEYMLWMEIVRRLG